MFGAQKCDRPIESQQSCEIAGFFLPKFPLHSKLVGLVPRLAEVSAFFQPTGNTNPKGSDCSRKSTLL